MSSSGAGPSTLRRIISQSTGDDDSEVSRISRFVGQLTLEDVDALTDNDGDGNGKTKAGSDADLAHNLFAEEMRSSLRVQSDREFALRLQQREPLQQRDPPMPVPRVPARPTALRRTGEATSVVGWFSALLLMGLFSLIFPNREFPSREVPNREESESSISLPTMPSPKSKKCASCLDAIRGVYIRAPCGDFYDVECISELFSASTRDESLFPPRCCGQHIPLDSVRRHLKPDLLLLFAEKSKELSTPNRVYCSRQTCSRFLGPHVPSSGSWFGQELTKTYTCPSCSISTCANCKLGVPAQGHKCTGALDDLDRAFIRLGERSGWVQCPACNRMIELKTGCNHMTCLCRKQFCYLCRATWKTCFCAQWDEHRLYDAAAERVDRINNGGAGNHVAPRPVEPVIPRPPTLPPRRPATGTAKIPNLPNHTVQPASSALLGQHANHSMQRPLQTATPILPVLHVPPRVTENLSRSTHDGWIPQVSLPQSHHASTSRAHTIDTGSARPVPPASSKLPKPVVNLPSQWNQRSSERDRLIRETMEKLRVDHECEHKRWTYRDGGGRCEMCHHRLPLYLFRCGGCQMFACNRCRKNRI